MTHNYRFRFWLPKGRKDTLNMKQVVVNDSYQKKYTYTLTENVWENFHLDFQPELTPQQMLELGVFWGKYFWDTPEEFPHSWWEKAQISSDGEEHKEINFYWVIASQPLSVWKEKLWIHPDDPRWWFQWYCRYYMGRRHEDDDRQIQRWKMMRRHIAQVKKHCIMWDPTCRPKQRQALLHWAYDSRKI